MDRQSLTGSWQHGWASLRQYANGANAISIIIPCHRVIGSDNTLTGYGGGLEAKKFLLELEQTQTNHTVSR